ncbi:DNA polymerase zeta processivity subunit, variant 2 [Stylosanthes scabra]|uniref:DNA polymerase zeta processivity subunit, variant 2 n=1 Tax=Stylosanthes scabra TaxID=79078 RepID=A0ABU6Q8Z5_9FABA|nr:DNA polymerase zeta processivity subunit, variant 2 [Stylosanthes scabra]
MTYAREAHPCPKFEASVTMQRKENQTPQGKAASVLVEFLEVAITAIVFLKGFYPSGAFERRRYMNLVVQKARQPQLRYYIHASASGLLPFLLKGMVDRVAVIFFNSDNVPLEKFVFRFAVNLSYRSAVEEADLEISLRSFLSKLLVSESLTKKLTPDCRWEITCFFRSLPETGASKEANLWIPTEDTKQWEQPPLITPISFFFVAWLVFGTSS